MQSYKEYSVPKPAERVFGPTRLSVLNFGARGDGRTDDTAAFNKAIAALPSDGGTVYVPRGNYVIDPLVSIKARSNLHIQADDGVRYLVVPNSAIRYGVFALLGVNNVKVSGGTVYGDRYLHNYTTVGLSTKEQTHEWGHAMQLYGCSQVTIEDMVLRDLTGDGISMASKDVTGDSAEEQCFDIHIRGVISTNNRRQGISVGKASDVVIEGCELSYTNGTLPMCGIDIEPENRGRTDGVWIHRCLIVHNEKNAITVLKRSDVDTPLSNVNISENFMRHNMNGVYSVSVDGLNIFDNDITHNEASGINIGPGSKDVFIEGNVLGFNYNRGTAGTDRTDKEITGWNTTIQRDILPRNTTSENFIGSNRYI